MALCNRKLLVSPHSPQLCRGSVGTCVAARAVRPHICARQNWSDRNAVCSGDRLRQTGVTDTWSWYPRRGNPMLTHYKVFPALHSESREGWVWLPQCANLTARNIRIRNRGTSIVCERRLADANFRTIYGSETGKTLPDNSNFIVMSSWYRERLGILATQIECTLDLQDAGNLRDKHVYTFLDHPNPAVRVSILMGLISLFLGFVGVVLGMLSLCRFK